MRWVGMLLGVVFGALGAWTMWDSGNWVLRLGPPLFGVIIAIVVWFAFRDPFASVVPTTVSLDAPLRRTPDDRDDSTYGTGLAGSDMNPGSLGGFDTGGHDSAGSDSGSMD